MPGPSNRRRRAVEDDDDDKDVDSDNVAQSRDNAASHNANKRARLDDGSARRDTADTWALTPPVRTANARQNRDEESTRVTTRGGAPSRHQPGSVLRVTVKNFVTYTAATFDMGPALNMVIGPNGTGKSTLVCAICLGLGWGTQHLGRAKELSEFVKHGCSEAEIEIELKGHQGNTNPIIRRNIRREGNKSSWHIDGQSSTLKNVLALAKGFSIQIDNLCQFLPQDRVVEFAQLSPVELLASTQRAAAPPQMSEWHEELKKLRADQKTAEKSHVESKQSLANLENRQNLQREDVERMRERLVIQDKVAMLEKIRPFAHYTVAKEKAQEAHVRKAAGDQELIELNKELAPSLRAMDEKKVYVDSVAEVVTQKRKLYERAQAGDEAVDRDHAKATEAIAEHQRLRKSEQKGIQDRKRDIETTERKIHDIKVQMQEQPIEVDLPAFNERSREKQRQIRELEEDILQRRQTKKDRMNEIGSRTQRIKHAEDELINLSSQAGQQTNKLRQVSQDTAKAWDWIQANRAQFKSHVYGPPVVECTVEDKHYVDAIEALFQANELTAITCTDRADFQLLSRQLQSSMRLQDITLRTCLKPLSDYPPPLSDEEMHALGLEGWALSYLKGPEPVLSMLCNDKRLHQTGVVLKDITDQHYATLESSAVSNWVTSKAHYQITRRREYGPGAVSTRVRDIQPARVWTSQPVDIRAERQLREIVDTCTSEMAELKDEHEQIDVGIRNLTDQIALLRKEKKEIEDDKAEQQKVLNNFKALPSRLETLEKKLTHLRSEEGNVRKKLQAIAKNETESVIKKGQITIDYQRKVDLAQQMHSSLITASIAIIEAQSDLEILKARSVDTQRLLREKELEVRQLEEEKKTRRDEAKHLMNTIRSLTAREPAVSNFWNAMPEEEKHRSPEELELEIDSLQARLESLHGGNPGAIKEFERRALDIEQLKEKLAGLDTAFAELEGNIKTIRDQWEPQLDALVGKISHAFGISFERINCAGAVSVFKGGPAEGADRDFENWAVQVQVRFREGEQMSILDSHRQSGGERAVSTIFYLMALQSLSRAPFRVVDEINQGMDPRNERMVHERMVDIACGSGEGTSQTSQYFLITPKLLAGLKYSPGMKVHCIASGAYMPKNGKELDFKLVLARARAMRGLPVAAAA